MDVGCKRLTYFSLDPLREPEVKVSRASLNIETANTGVPEFLSYINTYYTKLL